MLKFFSYSVGQSYINYYKVFLYINERKWKKLTTISVRIDDTEKKKLEEFARKEDLTMSQIIRKALKEYLKNKIWGGS